MKSDDWFEVYAEEAYKAYGKTTDHKNYAGLPMPTWNEIVEKSPKIHKAWINATRKIFEVLHVRDSETGELYAIDGVFNQIDEGHKDA